MPLSGYSFLCPCKDVPQVYMVEEWRNCKPVSGEERERIWWLEKPARAKLALCLFLCFGFFFFFFCKTLKEDLKMLGKRWVKVRAVLLLTWLGLFIFLIIVAASSFSFFFNLCKWNKDTFPLNLLSFKKIYFMYFFCLFTASELAKTPRKSVSLNMKNDPKITIDIPQCSKGKILPQLFKESFQELLQIIVYYFFFFLV